VCLAHQQTADFALSLVLHDLSKEVRLHLRLPPSFDLDVRLKLTDRSCQEVAGIPPRLNSETALKTS